jgi:hypothetical protein
MLEASSTLFTCQTATSAASQPPTSQACARTLPFRSDANPHPLSQRSSALVEADGIEPTTPCLQSRCSPTELRPLVPVACQHSTRAVLVGPGRFELPTSRLSSARSNQLSYEPGSFAKIPGLSCPSFIPLRADALRGWLSYEPGSLLEPTQKRAALMFRIGKGYAGGGMASVDDQVLANPLSRTPAPNDRVPVDREGIAPFGRCLWSPSRQRECRHGWRP